MGKACSFIMAGRMLQEVEDDLAAWVMRIWHGRVALQLLACGAMPLLLSRECQMGSHGCCWMCDIGVMQQFRPSAGCAARRRGTSTRGRRSRGTAAGATRRSSTGRWTRRSATSSATCTTTRAGAACSGTQAVEWHRVQRTHPCAFMRLSQMHVPDREDAP